MPRAVSSTLGRPGSEPARPYRYRGRPGWDPALVAATFADTRNGKWARNAKARRLVAFAELRAEGLSVAEASERLHLAERTGRDYEAIRLRREAAGNG